MRAAVLSSYRTLLRQLRELPRPERTYYKVYIRENYVTWNDETDQDKITVLLAKAKTDAAWVLQKKDAIAAQAVMPVASNTRSRHRTLDEEACNSSRHPLDLSKAQPHTELVHSQSASDSPRAAPAWATLATVVAWCVCSGGRMFANKLLYSAFPFPLLTTGASQLVAYAAGVALTTTGVFPYRPCTTTGMRLRASLPTCIATCATLYSGNAAVMLLPVTFVQIAKGLTPSLTLILAAAMGTEQLSLRLVLSVLLISVGSGISCLQGGSMPGVSASGFALQLVACVSEALRAIFIRNMQTTRPEGYNLAESLRLLCLSNAVLLLLSSALFEAPAVWVALPSILHTKPGLLLGIAGSSVLTDLTCFLALKMTSSLTFKVAGVAKNVATMLIGVTVLGETVTSVQAAGYFVATAATVFYSTLRGTGVRAKRS